MFLLNFKLLKALFICSCNIHLFRVLGNENQEGVEEKCFMVPIGKGDCEKYLEWEKIKEGF
jgi:hypothetical protein